jgi:hypothetical protein
VPLRKFSTFFFGCVCVCVHVRACGRAGTHWIFEDFKTFVYCQEIITVFDLVWRKYVAGDNYCVCVCVFVWSTEINCFSEIPYGEVAFDLANI